MLWKRLLDLRDYRDLSQKDVADVLGISRQTYSLWELGIKIIPLKHLNTLCNFYDVSMDYVLNLSNKKNYKNIMQIKELDRIEIGKRLKTIRDNNNLSFRTLAIELNTTPSTIHAYEHGKTLILTAFAYQICKKYKISLDWLCGKLKENGEKQK